MKNAKELQYLYDLGLIYELGSNISSYAVVRDCLSNNPNQKSLIDDIDSFFNTGKLDKNYIINSLESKHNHKYIDYELSNEEYNNLCKKIFVDGQFQAKGRTTAFLDNIKGGIKELFYFQGNFINPISLEHLNDKEPFFYQTLINKFLGVNITTTTYDKYIRKGCFLKADNILAVVDRYNRLHINIVDNKMDLPFLLKTLNKENGVIEGLAHLGNVKNKKLQFSNIKTDTSSLDFSNMSKALIDYVSISNDKNILKLIQAGSYAQSFLNFLESCDLLDRFKDVYISLSGDTNTDLSIINLKLSNKNTYNILKNMRDIYIDYNRDSSSEYRRKILKNGIRKISRNFNKNNRDILNQLLSLDRQEKLILTLSERVDDFVCTTAGHRNMQVQHTEAIIKEFFEDKNKVICFLAGCPGIGKTYAYKMYVTKHANNGKGLDKYLTLYFSPRNAINEDFIQFFFIGERLKYDDMIILNSTSVDEKIVNGKLIRVVNYSTNKEENLLSKDETNLTYMKRGRNKTTFENNTKLHTNKARNKIYEDYMPGDGVMKKTVEAVHENIYKAPRLNKIIGYFTTQSLKRTGNSNTSKVLSKILQGVVSYNSVKNSYIVNPEAFDKFAELCPNIFIMIDEITGSSEGAQLYNDIKSTFLDNFYNLLTDEQKEKITLKILVADANLPNENLMSKYLDNKSKIEQDKIFLSSIDKDIPQGVYTREVDEYTIAINANAYPAKAINMNYHIYNNSHEIKRDINSRTEKDRLRIYKANEAMKQEIDDAIINNAIKDITEKGYLQTILFIQNKKRIVGIVDKLNESWSILKRGGGSLKKGRDYIILNADLTERERVDFIKLVEDDAFLKLHNLYPPSESEMDDAYKEKLQSVQYLKDKNIDLKFVLMTSTASRGISFKTCRSMHILLQTSKVESFLTELSQAVFRPRGNWEFDRTHEKDLNFYIANNILYQEEDKNLFSVDTDEDYYEFEYRKNVSILNLLSYLYLVKGTIMTRIKGYSELDSKKISIVPVSGKYVSSASSTMLEQLSGYRKQLSDIYSKLKGSYQAYNQELCEDIISNVNDLIIQIFNNTTANVSNTVIRDFKKIEDIYSCYIKSWESTDLKRLLNLNVLHEYKVINGMVVFKIASGYDELNFDSALSEVRESLLKELEKVMNFSASNDSLKQSTSRIIQLLEYELEENRNETLSLQEKGKNYNRYVAIPIHVFTSYNDVLKYDYSNQYKEDEAPINALESMRGNIKLYTDCQSVFPIVSDYTDNYPFIIFKSDNLESIYNSKYNKDYILSSTTTNIFNLLLL